MLDYLCQIICARLFVLDYLALTIFAKLFVPDYNVPTATIDNMHVIPALTLKDCQLRHEPTG